MIMLAVLNSPSTVECCLLRANTARRSRSTMTSMMSGWATSRGGSCHNDPERSMQQKQHVRLYLKREQKCRFFALANNYGRFTKFNASGYQYEPNTTCQSSSGYRYCFSSTPTYDPVNDKSLLTVSIVGPPNAGKSTLFNRLLCKESNKSYRLSVDKRSHKRKGRTADKLSSSAIGGTGGAAIVSPVAGTTRDRRECIGRIGSVYFRLYDTAGIDTDMGASAQKKTKDTNDTNAADTATSSVHTQMMNQTIEAARAADLVLLIFDARHAGITSDLLETTKWLRKVMKYSTSTASPGTRSNNNNKCVVVCANKLEGTILQESWSENVDEATYRLGFGTPVLLSALHGDGIADIAVIIEQMIQAKAKQENEQQQQLLDKYQSIDSSNRGDTSFDAALQPFMDEQQQPENNLEADNYKEEKPLQLAILGRPNVGKSTLVNSLVQSDRVLTGATPGLTRDAISIPWMWKTARRSPTDGTKIAWNRPMQIVDTAGIRKPSVRRDAKLRTNDFIHADDLDSQNLFRMSDNMNGTNDELALLEEMAVADAMRALKIADVVVLVLDAQAGVLHKHELAICNAVLQEGRALVIAANKMDLLVRYKSRSTDEEYTKDDYAYQVREQLESSFPILRKTPIVPMSSLTGEGVSDLLPVVFHARDRWARMISTGQLNRWLNDAVLSRHAPPPNNRKIPVRIKYVVQTNGRPPTFLLFCSGGGKDNSSFKTLLPDSYLRYLVRHFQDTFSMYGMEIRFAIKNSNSQGNPYDNDGSKTRGGAGIGGREARKKRFIHALKTTGAPPQRQKRSRRSR